MASIKLPKHFKDVTVKQFQEYQLAKNDIDKVSALSGSKKDVMKVRISDIPKLITICDVVMSEQTQDFNPMFTFDGVDYGFEPNLQGMHTALYVDVATWCQPENFNASLLKIMAAFYRPITKKLGKKYEIETYDAGKLGQRIEHFENVSASILGGVLSFFTVLKHNLKATTLASLEDAIKTTEKELLKMKKRNQAK